MEQIISSEKQLPEAIEDLITYDKYYSARQPVYRKLLHEVKDWKEATDEEKRILKRAQDEAEYLIDVRAKIGEFTAKIPKATPNNNPFHEKDSVVHLAKPKAEILKDNGITEKQKQRYEALAKEENKPIIEKVKAEARENNELVTQTQILKEIKRPHVINNSEDNEWYTPFKYIEAAKKVLGNIDLDPASNEFANETIKATTYYTENDNGLTKEWFGNIWMNPPYSTSLLSQFADKLIQSNFNQAIVLVNNAYAKQLISFEGLKFEGRNGINNVTPTDIDGLVQLDKENCFILFELKHSGSVPIGQANALTKLCDAVEANGVGCAVIVAEHNVPYPEKIIAKDAIVKKIYWNGKWYKESRGRKLYDVALNFINYTRRNNNETIQRL